MGKSITKVCAFCGKEFNTKYAHRVFCGDECADEKNRLRSCARQRKMRGQGKTDFNKKCTYCGEHFKTVDSRYNYCSESCRIDKRRKQDRVRYRQGKVTLQCQTCGKEFRGFASRKYCSGDCNNQFNISQRRPRISPRGSLTKPEFDVIQLLWKTFDYAPLKLFFGEQHVFDVSNRINSKQLFYEWIIYTVIFQTHLTCGYDVMIQMPDFDKEAFLAVCWRFNITLMDSEKFTEDMKGFEDGGLQDYKGNYMG